MAHYFGCDICCVASWSVLHISYTAQVPIRLKLLDCVRLQYIRPQCFTRLQPQCFAALDFITERSARVLSRTKEASYLEFKFLEVVFFGSLPKTSGEKAHFLVELFWAVKEKRKVLAHYTDWLRHLRVYSCWSIRSENGWIVICSYKLSSCLRPSRNLFWVFITNLAVALVLSAVSFVLCQPCC